MLCLLFTAFTSHRFLSRNSPYLAFTSRFGKKVGPGLPDSVNLRKPYETSPPKSVVNRAFEGETMSAKAKILFNTVLGITLSVALGGAANKAWAEDSTWVQLFNGKDLSDWDIKFAGKELNVNFNNTFKVVDSAISVDYSGWTRFSDEFGHAANKTKAYSHYLLRVEYQVGPTQVTGGPAWAVQNNGLMVHSQSMASMTLKQDFPISMETQLLGAGNTGSNPKNTMNLCTPGTAFYNNPSGGSVNMEHCVPSTATARPAPGTWAWVSVSVMGDSIIRHFNQKSPTGTPVFTYYRPVYWTGNVANPPANTPANGTPLKSGYIAIQAETHPYKFRKMELLDLEGCMDKASPAYRTYFVKSNAALCAGTAVNPRRTLPQGTTLKREAGGFSFLASNLGNLEVTDASGRQVLHSHLQAGHSQHVSLPQRGLYVVTWRQGAEITRMNWANF